MTLEERIKEIEEWANAYNKSGTLPCLNAGLDALKIICELQNKNKELEAKLEELSNDQ